MLPPLTCKGCEQTPCACYSEAQRIAHAHETRLERVADALEELVTVLRRPYQGEPEPKRSTKGT